MTVSLTPRGLAAGRFIKSIGIAHGDPLSALAFAEGQHQWRDTSSVVAGLKSVSAMTSDGILPNMIFSDFMALPRARALLDRIEGWRRVPMNVPTLKATGDAPGCGSGRPGDADYGIDLDARYARSAASGSGDRDHGRTLALRRQLRRDDAGRRSRPRSGGGAGQSGIRSELARLDHQRRYVDRFDRLEPRRKSTPTSRL